MDKALITCPCHEILRTQLLEAGVHCDYRPDISKEEVLEIISEYALLVVSTGISVDKALIDRGSSLEQVGRLGSGLETIEQAYLKEKNIALSSSPEGNARAVAEFVLARIMEDSRHVARSMEEVKLGIWKRNENRGDELEAKRIGIIGYGANGSLTAELCRAIGMKVIVYDKYKNLNLADIEVAQSAEELIENIDYLSFHVPYTPETFHYFDDALLACAKSPFHIINISRGEVLSTATILHGLDSGMILSALLDVVENEKQDTQNKIWSPSREIDLKLRANPKVKITPHIAGYSYQAMFKMSEILGRQMVSILGDSEKK